MEWVRRNRRRLAVGGGVLGGLYIVGRLAERQLARSREEEGRQVVERARKAQHFTATEATAAHTLEALLPALRDQVERELDADAITAQLRLRPPPEEKLALWHRLKVVSICRSVCLVLGSTHLAIMLRTQLNILAGRLYEQETCCPPGPRLSPATQQSFLDICHHFVTTGTRELCSSVESVVTAQTAGLGLQQKLTLAQLEALLTQVFEGCRAEKGGIFRDPAAFFLSRQEQAGKDLDTEEQEKLKQLLADSLDVLESEDTTNLALQVCRQGLAHLLDKVADYYTAAGQCPPPRPTKDSGSESDSDSGFVSPVSVSLPVAKLLPIMAAQVRPGDVTDPWLSHLQDSSPLRSLAANVYEAFCQAPLQESASWSSTLIQSATSWYWRVV